jgi:hypothetical protein
MKIGLNSEDDQQRRSAPTPQLGRALDYLNDKLPHKFLMINYINWVLVYDSSLTRYQILTKPFVSGIDIPIC